MILVRFPVIRTPGRYSEHPVTAQVAQNASTIVIVATTIVKKIKYLGI